MLLVTCTDSELESMLSGSGVGNPISALLCESLWSQKASISSRRESSKSSSRTLGFGSLSCKLVHPSFLSVAGVMKEPSKSHLSVDPIPMFGDLLVDPILVVTEPPEGIVPSSAHVWLNPLKESGDGMLTEIPERGALLAMDPSDCGDEVFPLTILKSTRL